MVLALLAMLARFTDWYILPLIISGGALFVLLVGVLQLRQDDRIPDKTFITLTKLVVRQLPGLKKLFKDLKPIAPYSSHSLNFYAPGDFYDAATGERVKPYGISWKAWEDHKLVVVLKGDYCQVTGMSKAESKAKWEAWWTKQEDGK